MSVVIVTAAKEDVRGRRVGDEWSGYTSTGLSFRRPLLMSTVIPKERNVSNVS